jgi:hypothetical protein
MFVLDKSGSMVAMPAGFWDHDADPGTPEDQPLEQPVPGRGV